MPMQTQDYLGITIQTIPLRVFLTLKWIQKLSHLLQDFLSTRSHPVSVWRQLLGIMSPMSALVPGSRLRMRALQIRLNVAGRLQLEDFRVEWDSDCHQDLLWWSDVSHLTVGMPLGESLPDLCLFTDVSDTGWGRISRRRPSLRLVVSPLLSVFHQSPRASGSSVGSSGFPSFSSGTCGGGVLRQHHRLGVPQETGWYSIRHSQHDGSVSPQVLRGFSHPASSAVHPRQDERPRRLSESQEPSHRFRVGSMCRGVSPASSSLASHHRPLCDLLQSQVAGLLLSDGGPSVGGYQRHAPELGWPSGLCLSSLRPPFSSPGEGPTVQRVGVDADRPVLAATSLVPGPSRASGEDSLLPATTEGSSQTAPLTSLLPEPPRASADCLAYLQRSVRHSGFSSAVARQLTLCRRRSTRLNYQAKWAVYRAWCCRHGHSVSRPSVAKVADFLLYLRRFLSLSYSSITSYRSMVSGVFRFILPELSSHFVLHDLLRTFRLERPLPSSRVPPWDLLLVLRFMSGPPFEPLSSCSLRDLTQKVLFLVPLATARRVRELQAVSWDVSFSGSEIYLSYLPEFRAKTESSANPLPRSFCVRSLSDFVGDLPDELLLCPVRSLRLYLSRVSSISPRPCTLFVSPRSLSKNALSCFLRDVITRAYSSPSASSSSGPSSSSSSSSSAFRAHCIRGVAASWAFSRNAPLSSNLAAAIWSSSSVFTSFYLRDVQFFSSHGFGLGSVVAASNVV